MNLTELAHIIKSPQAIESSHISAIKELVDKHPYSQIFTLLYLEGLSKTKDVNFETELGKYAFQITDREQLFNLIHQSTSESTEVTTAPILVEEKIEPISEKEEIVEATRENESQKETEITDSEENEVAPTVKLEERKPLILETPEELTLSSTHIQEKEEAEEIEQVEEEIKAEEPAIPDADIPTFDPLELDIIASAVSDTIEKEVIEEMDKSPSIEITIEEDTQQSSPKGTSTGTKSFIDWLKENNQQPKVEQKDSHKENIDALVEKFIAEEPKISKPKKEFFSPNKIAKQSLEESTLPVSETLAKIFVVQGNFPKAISAYNTLMLKYPEKKVFFADQIKELEQKLNK